MAIRAEHRQVRARQWKPCVLVPTERELCWLEALQVVAGFAAILMRGTRKLTLVNVFVTILALCLRDLKERLFTLQTSRHVAFVAGNLHVSPFQRVFCGRVIFDGKCGRLEAIHRVTLGAFTAAGTTEELPLVRVLMAVHAFRKRYRRLEVPMRVAVAACHGRMFAQQRKLCLGMIESLQLSNAVPVRRVMARLTGGAKTTLVRIRMTRRAFCKRNPCVFHVWLCIGDGRVALSAGRFFVRAGQREFRLGVVKERRRLPTLDRVAARAIFPQLPAVFVLMAACALRGQSKISPIEFLDEYSASGWARNEFRLMAVLACDTGMLSGKRKARLGMVHGLTARFPVDELKFDPVVLGMAGRAIFAGSARSYPHRVHPTMLIKSFADFHVAVQAFHFLGAAAKIMAFRAVGWPRQGLMGFRKGAWGDLRGCRLGEKPDRQTQ